MAPSERDKRVPDKDAQEDDERQYGHGPLSAEELEQKHVTKLKPDFLWLTVSGILIDLIIIQRPYHFMNSLSRCSTPSLII
jgi:hypothetical protein